MNRREARALVGCALWFRYALAAAVLLYVGSLLLSLLLGYWLGLGLLLAAGVSVLMWPPRTADRADRTREYLITLLLALGGLYALLAKYQQLHGAGGG